MKRSLTFLLMIWAALFTVNLNAQSETFKPGGKVWGYAFGDAFYKVAGDTSSWASRAEYSRVPEKVYAFTLRRMYLGYDYNISPTFSTSALLEGSDVIQSSGGDRSVTIKNIYLRWKGIYPGADLIFGQIPTLAFSTIPEKVWGYRSIEKTLADQRGVRSSSDFGVALHTKLDTLGNFGLNLMIGNGTGTRPEELSESGKHKIYSAEVFGYFLDRTIVVDLYGDYQTASADRNVITLKGFAAYQSDPFTIGAEVMTQTHQNIKSDGADATPFGFSVFARGRIIEDKLNAFIRYDSYDPDDSYRAQDVLPLFNPSQMARHYEEMFFTAGLDWMPHQNVHIMPNIWINSYKPKMETEVLVPREADIVPRLTFYFIFR